MSTTVAKKVPIGPVQIYWNDVRMGSPKSQATFRYSKETVQGGLEDHGLNVISRKTKEIMEVDVVIADFDMANMRYIYDSVTGFDAVGTISTEGYSSSTSSIQRYREQQTLAGTTENVLDRATYVSGTINVWDASFATAYTRGTDFTSVAASGSIARITEGSIDDGATVIVEYNHTSTVSAVFGGGQLADFEAELKLVHELDGGKVLQFKGFRAKHIGASDMVIAMAAEFAGIPMTFHLLGDLTKNPGKQLFEFSLES